MAPPPRAKTVPRRKHHPAHSNPFARAERVLLVQPHSTGVENLWGQGLPAIANEPAKFDPFQWGEILRSSANPDGR